MTLADTPPTIVQGGTSQVTTAPGDDRAVADAHARGDDDLGAHPHVTAQADRGGMSGGAVGHCQGVVEGRHDDVVADEAAVPDPDAVLVLEAAPGVDEDVLPQVDIGAEVGGEGREEAEGVGHGTPGDPPHEGADLLRSAVPGVELGGEPLDLDGAPVLEGGGGGAGAHGQPGVDVPEELRQVHGVSHL